MLTKNEIQEIQSAKKNKQPLSKKLKLKLIDSYKKKEAPFYVEAQQQLICCDTGTDAPTRYMSVDKQFCDTVGGTVVSNSFCTTSKK